MTKRWRSAARDDGFVAFGRVRADSQVVEPAFANLPDLWRNPGWRSVLGAATWPGRRMPTWHDLFAA